MASIDSNPSHWHLALNSSNITTPFYFTPRSRLIPCIADDGIAILTPLLTYWGTFLFFQFLNLCYPHQKSLRRRPRSWPLILEIQLVQTAFGWMWLKRFETNGPKDPVQDLLNVAKLLDITLPLFIGNANARVFLDQNGKDLVLFAYWWAIPLIKQFFALFIIDAWQTVLNQLLINCYLFPDVRAFLFDTLGACIAYSLSGLSARGAITFLALSVVQTFIERPRSSPKKIRSPIDSSVFKITPPKPKKYVPFQGFRRQAYIFARWYFQAIEIESADSRRIRYAMYHSKHQALSGPKQPRPQLRIIT